MLRYLTDTKRGVRADEMKWSNLDEYLKERADQKVTPQEVKDFLERPENQVEVHEVTRREALTKDQQQTLAGLRSRNLQDLSAAEARRLENLEAMEEKAGGTKFGQYTLPGGENYREVVLTRPVKTATYDEWLANVAVRDPYRYEAFTADPARGRRAYEGAIRDNVAGESGTFRSGHFDDPNVLAHFRLNDRIDAEGKKVLFVEEIQSDWAQKGRREGFDRDWERDLNEYQKLYGERESISYAIEEGVGTPAEEARAKQIQARLKELDARYGGDIENVRPGNIPSAPFVTSTEGWTNLAMKRILRMAAEQGYDRVAWTTGEQQAARYDLSKKISRIAWDDTAKILRAWDHGGKEVIEKHGVAETELADHIGKEAADKILAQSGRSRELSGLDLKVGGEGMKGFYDEILPGVAGKLGKKFGAKVGQTRLTLDARQHPNTIIPPVHSIDITPEMRASVTQQGQPLFRATEGREIPGIKIDTVQRVFPTGKVAALEGGGWDVTLPNGRRVGIRVSENGIEYNPEAFKAGRQREKGAAEQIVGSWQKMLDRNSLVLLAKEAGEGTLRHEAFHEAMNMALTDKERKAVIERYGDEETAADAYAAWSPAKGTNSWFSKIYALAKRMYRSFKPNWESAFERTHTGEAFGKAERAPRAEAPKYSTAGATSAITEEPRHIPASTATPYFPGASPRPPGQPPQGRVPTGGQLTVGRNSMPASGQPSHLLGEGQGGLEGRTGQFSGTMMSQRSRQCRRSPAKDRERPL